MMKPAMLHRVPTTARVVAFSFDDGPHPVYTAQLLDIFRQVGGKATFFMLGQHMDAHLATAAERERKRRRHEAPWKGADRRAGSMLSAAPPPYRLKPARAGAPTLAL